MFKKHSICAVNGNVTIFQINFHGILVKDTNLTAISVSPCNELWSSLGDVKEE